MIKMYLNSFIFNLIRNSSQNVNRNFYNYIITSLEKICIKNKNFYTYFI
jgi:hypothetical protein